MGTYNYHTQTPGSKQWDDFKNDMTSLEKWEASTFFVGSIALGGSGIASKTGTLSREMGMLRASPIQETALSQKVIIKTLEIGQPYLRREFFKIHPRISQPGYNFRYGQLDVGHRASTFFSTEIIKTGKIGIKNYRTIYINKTIGDRVFSIGINPWKRTIFHEGPGLFK